MTFIETSNLPIPRKLAPDWTDERIETLKTMWAAGHTASYIAGEMGGVTRSAVIGKVHRLQLDARRVTIRAPHLSYNKPHKRVGFRSLFKQKPVIAPEILMGQPEPNPVYSVDALTRTNCRWPYGDPGAPGFHFCGAHALRHRPYCGPHHQIAYRPKG